MVGIERGRRAPCSPPSRSSNYSHHWLIPRACAHFPRTNVRARPTPALRGAPPAMPAKHDDASRRVPLSALFGSRRQRTTGLNLRFRNQACSLATISAASDRPDTPAYAPAPRLAPIPTALRTTHLDYRDSLELPLLLDAAGQRDYARVMALTRWREGAQHPHLCLAFAYHRAWRNRLRRRGGTTGRRRQPHVRVSAASDAPVASESAIS